MDLKTGVASGSMRRARGYRVGAKDLTPDLSFNSVTAQATGEWGVVKGGKKGWALEGATEVKRGN